MRRLTYEPLGVAVAEQLRHVVEDHVFTPGLAGGGANSLRERFDRWSRATSGRLNAVRHGVDLSAPPNSLRAHDRWNG